MCDNDENAVIIDNGSGYIKAGISKEDMPNFVISSVVGIPKYGAMVGQDYKELYIGDEAMNKRGYLTLTNPVQKGIIVDHYYMEKVWEYLYYNCFRIEPSEKPVHLTETPKNPAFNREKMAEFFFENFSVPAFYVSTQAVLSLYGTVRVLGVVYDSGAGITNFVPVFDGFSLKHAMVSTFI